MFKNKIAISKNFLIAICFISLILFAVNTVNAIDLNDSVSDGNALGIESSNGINAIDKDKLGNSQQDMLSQANTITLNNGKFSDIQDAINSKLNDGDTLILNGEFTTNKAESHIIIYKNITFTSTSNGILNAKNLSSIFIVENSGSGSSFSNLIFKNGNGLYGGAIRILAKDVTIDNCQFQDNYASSGGGAIYTDYYVEKNPDFGRNLLIKNSQFKNNRAAVAAGAIGAYGYNTRILNCLFESNSVYNKNGGGVYGGAMQVGKEEYITNSIIKNCKFINNKAISITGTKLSHGGASCLRNSVTYENCLFDGNSADFGGALTAHSSGTIKNCTFNSNTANDYGGAISNVEGIQSMNLKIIDCDFNSNSAPYGGAVRLTGNSITIDDCNFDKNYASIDGGAVFVETKIIDILDSNFNYNSAENNGGAVFINGESTNVQNSNFRYNTAIANPKVKNDGLGGAIYINGSSDTVNNNKFEYNVARNGSAIYYDNSGKNLKITNNVMFKNQAWVYALPIYAKDIYYGENVDVGAIIYGGNNIADYDNLAVSNAIYNAASNKHIVVNGEIPVSGATNSGQLYQDSREYNINILLTVKHSDGTVVYNKTLKSNYLGEITTKLNNLKVGTYTVTAKHFEDNYYKAIVNQTTFVVKPKIDVSVSKNTQYSEFNYHDQVVWTINVVNNGPNDASDVKVNDVLPVGLIFQSSSVSVGSYADGVWDIGNLAKGKTVTIKITTLINKTGSITNKATVNAKEFDWNTTNNQDSQKITVPKAIDLSIVKVANVTAPKYGDLVKWTLTVKNNGPDIAHDVIVSDVLPAGLTFKSSNGNYANSKWSVGTLNVGQSKSLEIVTSVTATGNIENTATVSGNEYDYDLTNNKASKTINVAKAADLEIIKTVDNDSPNYGSLVKWIVTVRNNGPDAASGVRVSDVLPVGLVYQSYSTSAGSYTNGVWDIGNLAKGKSVTLSIVCKINKTGSIKNVASVSGNEFDVDLTNNKDDASVKVAKAADLSVVKSVNNSAPNYGGLVKWTVTVRNNGPDAASGVRVSDVLPVGLVYQSSSVSVGSYADGVWDIGNLAKGKSVTLSIVCKINKTGSIKNVASVSGNEFDVDLTNNKDDASVKVAKAADLSVVKSVNNSAPNYGGLVKWTVTVRNNGPDAATGVVLSDVLPAGLVVKSASGNFVDGKWVIGSLASGKSQSFEAVTLVNKTGSLTNKVSVSGNEYDYNPNNNNASKSIKVPNAADLSVIKSVNETSPNYLSLVKWTVTVRNNGPDAASGVRVSDVLPVGLVYQSYSTSAGSYTNGVWDIGNLAKGKSVTLSIVCKINKTGSIKNVASVSGNEFDVDLTNNKDDASVKVAKAADLSVIKSVNETSPNYLSLVKWTVTVRNNGPDAASGVVLSDVLPVGLVYQSYSASVGSYADGVWDIGNLAKGKSVTLSIVCKINKTGSIKNVASVSGNEFDVDLTNNKDDASVKVAKAADLSVIKSVNETSPNYLSLVKWTVTVRNNGPDAATGVVLSDVLPAGLVVKSASGNFVDGKWVIGSLASGKSQSFEVVTLVNKTGSLTNKVSVSGNEYDYNPKNNNASKSIKVPKAADLSVIKSVNETSPNYLSLVKWTVTVRNNGPDAATGVVLSDVLPVGLVYQSYSASVGSYANGVWDIGNLANGKTVTLTIISKVGSTGSIINIVNVSGNEYDINKTNNVNNKIIDVPKACDLQIIKSVNDSTPNYHKLVKWTIIVNNNGPDNATGVLVEDILPQDLVIISSNANYTNGKWFIGKLNAFSSKILEITTLINKTGLLINNANIGGNEYDFNKSNNYDDSSIDVLPSSDLEIQKIVDNKNPLYNDTVKWIIIVKNNGPDKATGVKVNETLADSFELINSKLSKGLYINGIWTIGDLNVGEKVYMELITKIVKTGNFTNVVNVDGNEYDHNTSNNYANKSINVYPAVDLQITKKVNNSSPNYNDLVKWTVTVRNNGPDKANVIEIADILPKGLEFVGYNSTKGYYVDGFWKFCCLEVGETQSLDIVTRVKSIGNIKNIVSANAREYDYNPDNNKDESEITVPPAADLQITKLVNQSVVNYTNLVKWTLVVRNNGPNEATRVVVMDKLPEGLTFVSAQGDGTYSTAGTWHIGNIASGQSKELTIITRCDKVGESTNVAIVKGDQHDYNSTNDKGEKTIVVPPAADLAITKTVSKAQYFVDDVIKYTIEIVNNGPSTAENITVKEFMDDSLILKSVFAASGDYDNVNHIWHIKSLANGEKTYLNINAIATGEGLVNNMVSVISHTFDNNLKNNYAECIVEIIKKIIDPNSVLNPGLHSRFSNHNSLEKDLGMIAKSGIEMKSTGLPIGLLFAIALISIGFCTSNISRKR